MFGATTNYPFNFANRNGIPMLESNSVEVTDTNVIINIPNRKIWATTWEKIDHVRDIKIKEIA